MNESSDWKNTRVPAKGSSEVELGAEAYRSASPQSTRATYDGRVLRWNFFAWSPNGVYWDAPSYFRVFLDGTWEAYIERFANFRREHPVLDEGAVKYARFFVQYKDSAGLVVLQKDYNITAAAYGDETRQVTVKGHDHAFAALWNEGKIRSTEAWQRIT